MVFIALVANHIHWHTVSAIPAGSPQKFIGALVFVMTGFGLGWVNAAADYSRYLPRRSSGRGVIGWTTFGSSVAPIFLLVFGLLLAGSSAKLSSAIGADPIGALTTLLPTWFLVPFAIVAVLGLVGGSVLDIYSSGLALLTLGLRIPRYAAALIDGTVMVLGTIYVVFVAHNFLTQFEGFLITLGVPIAAWCGIMLADIMLRRKDYAEPDLYDPRGRYGDVRLAPLAIIVVATVIGWGLVTNTNASWLTWQGYLLGPLGLGGKTGAWAFANLGVLIALVHRVRRRPGRSTSRRSGPRSPRPVLAPATATGDEPARRACLAVIDMQRVFAEPGSPWLAPRFGEIVEPVRELVAAFRPDVVFTRFIAPAAPAGAWRRYYEAWPFALQPPDAPIYELVDEFAAGAGPTLDATTFSKWGPELAPPGRRRRAAGAGRGDHRLLRAVHGGGRGRRGRRGPGRRRRVRGRGRREPPPGAGHPPAVRPAGRGGQPG